MEVIKYKEIRKELVKKNIENMKILKILVYERIKDVSNNNFKIQEIIFWSRRFNITVEDFILKILMINYAEYNNFLKNKNAYIKSNIYNAVKEEAMKKKEKSYMKNINMNKRNYFDRKRLIDDSLRIRLNIIDFSTTILKKPKNSINRVLKSKDSSTRLYIGIYINSKLPLKYVNNNINNIQNVLNVSLKNIILRLGLRVNKEDYDDKINDGLLFLMENGNNSDINNNKIINDENLEFTIKHRKIFYWKSYYYYLNQFKKSKFVKEVEFIENIFYNNNNLFQDIEDYNNIVI